MATAKRTRTRTPRPPVRLRDEIQATEEEEEQVAQPPRKSQKRSSGSKKSGTSSVGQAKKTRSVLENVPNRIAKQYHEERRQDLLLRLGRWSKKHKAPANEYEPFISQCNALVDVLDAQLDAGADPETFHWNAVVAELRKKTKGYVVWSPLYAHKVWRHLAYAEPRPSAEENRSDTSNDVDGYASNPDDFITDYEEFIVEDDYFFWNEKRGDFAEGASKAAFLSSFKEHRPMSDACRASFEREEANERQSCERGDLQGLLLHRHSCSHPDFRAAQRRVNSREYDFDENGNRVKRRKPNYIAEVLQKGACVSEDVVPRTNSTLMETLTLCPLPPAPMARERPPSLAQPRKAKSPKAPKKPVKQRSAKEFYEAHLVNKLMNSALQKRCEVKKLVAKTLDQDWEALPDDERRPFLQKEREEGPRFEKQMEKYRVRFEEYKRLRQLEEGAQVSPGGPASRTAPTSVNGAPSAASATNALAFSAVPAAASSAPRQPMSYAEGASAQGRKSTAVEAFPRQSREVAQAAAHPMGSRPTPPAREYAGSNGPPPPAIPPSATALRQQDRPPAQAPRRPQARHDMRGNASAAVGFPFSAGVLPPGMALLPAVASIHAAQNLNYVHPEVLKQIHQLSGGSASFADALLNLRGDARAPPGSFAAQSQSSARNDVVGLQGMQLQAMPNASAPALSGLQGNDLRVSGYARSQDLPGLAPQPLADAYAPRNAQGAHPHGNGAVQHPSPEEFNRALLEQMNRQGQQHQNPRQAPVDPSAQSAARW
uniref:HMG box domain-containing protein n=1 Tax=Pinguiococcus pyrenoidosus TaxID=172671 RepID=A0A7R9UAG0_9STRA|mmetsp:Transcript_2983/g.12066  ORF Transcript_2983/g.12066 Transcript_2983/m.12066 type:complete len:769 (+) Transcript_2983:161-2467(+)